MYATSYLLKLKATNWSHNFRWAELNAKMLLANQIAGFLNFNISKTIGGIKLIFTYRYISVKATNSVATCFQLFLRWKRRVQVFRNPRLKSVFKSFQHGNFLLSYRKILPYGIWKKPSDNFWHGTSVIDEALHLRSTKMNS